VILSVDREPVVSLAFAILSKMVGIFFAAIGQKWILISRNYFLNGNSGSTLITARVLGF
jgi:hypothetical protein